MSQSKNQTPFTVDNLPRFSPWPARLLGLAPWTQRHKNPSEVYREYEHEKWGPLLERVQTANRDFSVEDVDQWVFEDMSPSLCFINGGFEMLTAFESHMRYLDLVERTLQSYLPAVAIVELGAGYGSMLLHLSKRGPFRKLRLVAGEYTPSGRELLGRLAKCEGVTVEVSHCDLASAKVVDLEIPADALLFTSYATHYVPKLSSQFVTALAAYRPRAVVHFEPCMEHCDTGSLLGLMRRRYMEVNDYNTNLMTVLREQKRRGALRILEERPTVFGRNPLLAASVVAWRPQ